MERECPDCKQSYDPELVPELNGACPKCMTDLLKDVTEPMSSSQADGLSTVPGMAPFDPGDTFNGMEILDFLGQGGMGYVYKARQTDLDRVVALKVLDPRLAVSAEFKTRFSREAKALASLNHPNIVQIYGFGSEEGYHYLVMELIDGTNLRQVMSTQSIEPEVTLRYVPQICNALEYAHAEGVVHRDIKPENILIDKQGNLKIADFGLAKISLADQQNSQITMTGQIMGTPNYMAPEQRKETGSVDHRADIYSLGVVFYEMLTGELPIGHFPLPSERVKVDVKLDEVVLKALATDPQLRYQRASEVRDDVTGTGPGTTAGKKRAKAHSKKSNSWLWIIVCTVILAILAVPGVIALLVFSYLFFSDSRPEHIPSQIGMKESYLNERKMVTRISMSSSDLTDGGARKLWENLADSLMNPESFYDGSIDLLAKAPKTVPELERIQAMFEPSMTASAGKSVNRFYGYPFTGIEKAHSVLEPTVIPTVLGGGRPTKLHPIKSANGTLKPEALRDFLKNAKISDLKKLEEGKMVFIVSDETHSFDVPAVFVDTHGWRLNNCALVEAIIDSIAVQSGK